MKLERKYFIALMVVLIVCIIWMLIVGMTRKQYQVRTVTFNSMSVTFHFDPGSTMTAFDWLQVLPINYSFEEKSVRDTSEKIFNLYEAQSVEVVYNAREATYYILNPGGYNTVSIVSSSDISSLAHFEEKSETVTNNTNEPDIFRKKCTETAFDTEAIDRWREVTCEEFIKEAGSEERSVGFVKSCYVPLGKNTYVAFDSPVKSAGSEIYTCEAIYLSGLRGATEK